jgi:hypothetical protein
VHSGGDRCRRAGLKELVGLTDGYRESELSWRELLVDLRQRGLEDQTSAARLVDQSGVAREERRDRGFDRLRQQRARAVPEDLGQRILRSILWATEADHVILVHGVSDPSAKG